MTGGVTKRPLAAALRAMASLALPMLLANAASMLVPAIDAWAMASLGRDALAGGGLAAGILATATLVTGGIVSIVSPLVAESRAKDDGSRGASREEALVGSGLVVAVALGAASAAALVASSRALFALLGAPEAAARSGAAYLQSSAPSLVPALVAAVMRHALNASGRARYVLFASAGVLAVKAIANVVVVSALPERGTFALGGAAVVAQLAMALILGRAARAQVGPPTPQALRLVVRLGLPIGVMTGLEVALFALSGVPVARFGVEALASHEIALQALFLAFALPLAIAQATSIRVAAAAGRDARDEVRAAAGAGVASAAACAVALAVALAAAAQALAAHAGAAAPPALTARLLRLAAVVHVLDAIQVALAFVLRGLRDTRAPAVICALSYGVVGPAAALAMIHLTPWAGAAWYAFTVTLAVTVAAYALRLRSQLRGAARGTSRNP